MARASCTGWRKVLTLNAQDLLHAPLEAFNEIERQDDTVRHWAKENKGIFVKESRKQLELVTSILNDYPFLADPSSEHNAEPWLIALALECQTEPQKKIIAEEIIIVTKEQIKGNRIPFVCQQKHNVKCLTIFDMFRLEGWKF